VYCTGVHGVKAGETCGSVARDARLPLPQFMDLNQNVTCGALFPGQWVCVRGVAIA
jgi:LysM repeat protein